MISVIGSSIMDGRSVLPGRSRIVSGAVWQIFAGRLFNRIKQVAKQIANIRLILFHRQRNSDAEEMLHRIDGHTAAVTFDDFADGGDTDAGALAVTLP